MTLTRAPLVEPLANRHDRNSFHCGEPLLDDYIRHRARQDLKRRVATVFVAIGRESHIIAGYYTLSAASLDRDDLPEAQAQNSLVIPFPLRLLGVLPLMRPIRGNPTASLCCSMRLTVLYEQVRTWLSTPFLSMPKMTP